MAASRAACRLRELQEAFLREVTGEGDGGAGILRSPRGGLEQRRAVYSSGYLTRLAEALEGDYPAVRRILGPVAFDALVTRYARAFPPRSFTLSHAGRALPRFLEQDSLANELPFLPDLALLERTVAEVFVATDDAALTWAELVAMPPQAVAELPIAARAGADVIRSPWPLDEIWRLRDQRDDDVEVDVSRRPTAVLVYRRGHAAECARVSDEEASLVEAARWKGVTLAEAQEIFGRDAGEDAVRRLLAAFRGLVERTVFKRRSADGGSDI